MPPVLHITPQEVDSAEKRSKYTVCVVGCGQRGILYANAFADAGFRVICTDADPSVVRKVAKGKARLSDPRTEAKLKSHLSTCRINIGNERKKAVSQSNVVIIAIGVKLDEQKKPDPTHIVSACKEIGTALSEGSLVVYCGVAGIGFVGGTLKETLENTSGLKVGESFGLAYNPILSIDTSIANLELKVAATDKTSLNTVATIFRTIASKVKENVDLKTQEIATLFSVTKLDANMALANELASFCENTGIDYYKVLKALEASDAGFLPTISAEGVKDEAYLLLDSAENLNVKLRLPALARQINEDMVKNAVNLTQDALRLCDKPLRRAKVAVLGTANPATVTGVFVKSLELKGAKTTVYDPLSKVGQIDWCVVKGNLNEAVEGTDCIVILDRQEQFKNLNLKKLKALMKTPSAFVDLTGMFERPVVEAEGFIYCGLGRGTDKV